MSTETSVVAEREEGLRPLERLDYSLAASVGFLLAGLTSLTSLVTDSTHFTIPFGIVAFGLGFLAVLDHATRLVRNKHTLIFAGVTLAGLIGVSLAHGENFWLQALIGATGAFLFLLVLAVISGFVGGGDIKLSPIPAGVLAAWSPLAALLWLMFTFNLCLIAMIAMKLTGSRQTHMAMVPFMALALIPTIIVTSLVFPALGIM